MKKIIVLSVLVLLLLFTVQTSNAGETLKIATTEWPPFEYTAEDGTPAGSDVEIVQAVFEEIGIPIEIEFYPWSRAEEMAEQGRVAGLFSLGINEEREKWLDYPDTPINISRNVFFYRKGEEYEFENLEDLKGLDIGITRGYSYGDEFLASDLYNLHEADSDELNFRMLNAGRTDLFICDQIVGVDILTDMGLTDEIGYLPKALSEYDMYIAFSKEREDSEELAKKFNQGLQKLQEDGLYQEILDEYI